MLVTSDNTGVIYKKNIHVVQPQLLLITGYRTKYTVELVLGNATNLYHNKKAEGLMAQLSIKINHSEILATQLVFLQYGRWCVLPLI